MTTKDIEKHRSRPSRFEFGFKVKKKKKPCKTSFFKYAPKKIIIIIKSKRKIMNHSCHTGTQCSILSSLSYIMFLHHDNNNPQLTISINIAWIFLSRLHQH